VAKGPYRADHVGSLIRPERLLAARERRQKGEMPAAELHRLEDECIREAVRLQEGCGLQVVTDGEFRRNSWNVDFLTGFENVKRAPGKLAVYHKHADGTNSQSTPSGIAITGKLKRPKPIQLDDFKFLKAVTAKTPKVCIPSPSLMHFRGGREAIDKAAYPDMAGFFDDLARVYAEEIEELGRNELTYLQIDDTNLAYLCDPAFRDAAKRLGEEPDTLPVTYCKLINDSIRTRPKDMTVCIHLCRGNATAGGAASGGYEPVADTMLNMLEVDGFFLEYDTERAGDFRPLRFLPKGRKKVVLGLVSTKDKRLEGKDELKRRIDEAAKFVPLEQLCLSPQCGFASVAGPRLLTVDDEKAKLTRTAEVAREVWGNA
jgi:5-methyltetrahydropteroyltriglutamate--homocysteine methyltransferase